jgi:hypothetical protein
MVGHAAPRPCTRRMARPQSMYFLCWYESTVFVSLYSNLGRVSMQWEDRIDNYAAKTGFPRSLFVSEDNRVVGTWIMGNDYRVKSSYYGGYPAGYLKRVKALFPEKRRVLHLFSGKVDLATLPGDTVDINPALKPTYLDDAQSLSGVPLDQYDLILADPPYSIEDAERYQTTMIKRNLVMRALQGALPGTHVVWLDQVLPMYRKDTFAVDAVIGMVKSTNHRFRVVTVFRRLDGRKDAMPGKETNKRVRKCLLQATLKAA